MPKGKPEAPELEEYPTPVVVTLEAASLPKDLTETLYSLELLALEKVIVDSEEEDLGFILMFCHMPHGCETLQEEKMIKDAQQKTGVFVNSHSYTRVRNTTDAPLIMILTENCGAQQRWTAVGTMSKMQGNGDTVATRASQDDLRSLLLKWQTLGQHGQNGVHALKLAEGARKFV